MNYLAGALVWMIANSGYAACPTVIVSPLPNPLPAVAGVENDIELVNRKFASQKAADAAWYGPRGSRGRSFHSSIL